MKSLEKVFLIDTNVVLRYLLGDHPELSPKATAFMLSVSKGVNKAEIPGFVMAECIYVMEKFYKIPKSKIVDKLSRIFNFTGIVNSNKSEILNALLIYESSNADIVDCILAARSSAVKVVITFDKDIKKLKAVSQTL
jgi:predicted nucleic-acid-binding protein